MEIRVLGAHNTESATTRMTSLLVDEVLAVDTGALTCSLSLAEQEKLDYILLTHCHYDHIRDVPAIAINATYFQKTIQVYSQASTLDAISAHVLNGIIYPEFTEIPTPDNPPLRFCPLEPLKVEDIGGYKVLAVPVHHAVPAVGYQVSSGEGRAFFYSGDSGPGLSACWEHVSPQLLIMDVTLSDRLEKHAVAAGHLTPRLLAVELAEFRKAKGYLPPVVVIHVSPILEDEIKEEVEKVAKELGADITVSYEGMRLTL
jgi:ribonuclease BN (tRNA processing enzyme)